ncbi:hypothetical protein DBR37_04840 [Herminiimonas sp. KBW02]|nr:hypothetical protein DBR37_04840 [Herminiimonas sp. KBW02]
MFDALDVRNDDWAKVYAAEIGAVKNPEEFDEFFYSFSDFITMSVKPEAEDIGLLIYTIFKVCRQLLGRGFASRGGIAEGQLFHRNGNVAEGKASAASSMIFGPAFIDAYQFESAHADGPRVILQGKVWQKIEDYKRKNPNTKLTKFFKVHIKRAEDGPAFIDLFADFHTNEYYENHRDLDSEMDRIKNYICESLDESIDRPLHFKKNAQLANEFNLAIRTAEKHAHMIPGSKLPKRSNS